ncbi:MAG: C2H2-type zinc finger protein [Candidatus Aenigmatarchaeota archaeon]
MSGFKCETCGKIFETKQALEQHAQAKHAESKEQKKKIDKKISLKSLIIYLTIFFIISGLGYVVYWALTAPSTNIGPVGSTHEHADIAIYLKGERITPFPPKYYVKSPYIHVESGPGAGYVIHIHAKNVPLKMFFNSLGMGFDENCFKLDNGSAYCNDGINTLKFYVKKEGKGWEQNYEYENYKPRDLDKILITYGNENPEQIKVQQDAVTDFARVESGYR